MKEQKCKVAVIGGGAAGMMAALSASRILSAGEVILLEKNSVLGRKLSATGNGRCNFSNRFCRWQDYGGQDLSLVRHAFDHLGPAGTEALFEELGIMAREESEGRLYPYSEQASAVTDALRDALKDNGVTVCLDTEVTRVKKSENRFIVEYDGGSVQARSLIIATGGKAGHRYGSTGDGYGFAKSFGHTLRRPLPALVQIVTENGVSGRLRGVRAKGAVSLIKGQELVAREEGEIQFIENGLSGICIFDLSRLLGEDPAAFRIRIDLFPEYSSDRLLELLESRKRKFTNRPAESLLVGMLHDKLITLYLELSGVDAGSSVCQVDEAQLLCLSRLLKCREVAIKGTKGWIEAQVTVGGVKREEVCGETLESKLVPGLFFAGEVLDIDGKCGGWNLQWAWSSGWTAGQHAAFDS
jgi:predicted Rossmann fold flavoprotein